MKTLRIFYIVLSISIWQNSFGQIQKDTISAYNANQYIGKNVVVKGYVISTYYAQKSNGSPTFLNFEEKYPHNPFTAIIYENTKNALSFNAKDYEGKTITVEGYIKAYNDKQKSKPSIIITQKEQIKIIQVP